MPGRHQVALLLVDLDRFKDVNDTFGHHVGDLLLQEVARRVRAVLRESDTVGRLGGDEFAVILPRTGVPGALDVAAHIKRVLERPGLVGGRMLDVGASVGIAVHPENGLDPGTLLQRADVAMYFAKRTRRGAAVYDAEYDQHTPDRLALGGELKIAIERGEVVPYFQPVVSFESGVPVRAEVLARWQHPKRGLLPPNTFIPLAEQTGSIGPLTRNLFDAALERGATWLNSFGSPGFAFNLSPLTLHDSSLVDAVIATMLQHRMPPGRITLELTETAVMGDPERSRITLNRLHELGVRIAIDDFGTGYSSLAYLKQLPMEELKIDKSFVIDMSSDESDLAIVRSTIDLAHDLSLKVTAEGIESRECWELLAQMRCDFAQGYYLSKPLSAEALEAWWRAARQVPAA